ncbi:right-handed parallel beta-helix repeat-containing protein [Ureibacillus aquaedulcis]|uniref:Right-handed parallel beta-helix repeat-containing protein n=1 Tax=Ureibacillus aquaedulcis TaxID=3058421 RepID=A0ABT8GT65_9BACL|nr:right-handed parallel beta-helix repeat-containing protein [Ureibacillus sp. BA0131]MDN4494111.1 right-handed parallel beta-helix repeat-containing protein [Ureibacillus sp. BA0131]
MKRIILMILAAAIIFCLTNINKNKDHQQNIYVATDGNDEYDGSKSKPFRTLKKAAQVAEAGTTVHIREGVYKEKLVIMHSGKKSKEIVFKPYKDEKVVLSGEELKIEEGDTSIIIIDNKNHVTIHGLTVQDLTTELASETVMGIFVTGSSSHITLDSNHVEQIETHAKEGNGHGIAVYATGTMEDIAITNNTVQELKLGASEALVLNGNIDGFKIEHNHVHSNDNIGIDLIGYEGVSTDHDNDFVRNGVVSNNTVHGISTYGNPAYGEEYSAAGIYVDGGRDITIEENTVYQNDIGIEATSEHGGKNAENIQIINNTIYENFLTGISIGGYDENRGGTINSYIAQNILYRNDTLNLDGGQLMLQHDVKDNTIEKNILTAGPSRIFIANFFTTNENTILSHNIFHREKGKDGIWIWKDEEYSSFPEFKWASNSDEESSYLEPNYVNPEAYDFNLKEDSVAREIMD